MKKLEGIMKRAHYEKNAYFVFSYFISCAFLGWIFETIVVLILNHKITARGFLFVEERISFYLPFLSKLPVIKDIPLIWGLPVIEIYGIGGCIIVLLFAKLRRRTVLLFVISMLSMTLFELVSSYISSYFFHQTYWDYKDEFMNFQGRICLRSSLAWGLISVIVVKYLTSKLELIYAEERRVKYYKNTMRIILSFTIICNIYKFLILK